MEDKHLCWPPYFFLGPTMAPTLFKSRIATAMKPFSKLTTRAEPCKSVTNVCAFCKKLSGVAIATLQRDIYSIRLQPERFFNTD